MTCRLPTPWWRFRVADSRADDCAGSVDPTATLDWESQPVRSLVAELMADPAELDERKLLQLAHKVIGQRVRPVYGIDDMQPASRTLRRGRGSCSQRLALLEAVSRGAGLRTRVHGLVVDGRFWYPRFPRLRRVVPDEVVLAWPEFFIDGAWVSASDLFGRAGSASAGDGFSNSGGETLFDAIARRTVDWTGASSSPAGCSPCDLSARVLVDLGRFDSRDDLFATHGQTLCAPARVVGDPLLSRWSAGASVPD